MLLCRVEVVRLYLSRICRSGSPAFLGHSLTIMSEKDARYVMLSSSKLVSRVQL